MAGFEDLKKAAQAVGEQHDADVLFLSGDIERPVDDKLITRVSRRKRRANVVLVLVTPGGDADAAYRIARCLQDHYEKFIALVPGWCKSAGTMCVLGAHELVMTDCAELGPLDVQVFKKDELGDLASGLVLKEALRALKEHAFETFEDYMLDIKKRSDNLITFKTATDIAQKLTIGMFEPIFRQIEPMQVGELERSMSIALAYGERLMIKSRNFGDESLANLVEAYPSHGFVIDRREAEQLFEHVRNLNGAEGTLIAELGNQGKVPSRAPADPIFLNDETKEAQSEQSGETGPQADLPRAGGPRATPDTGSGAAEESAPASGTDGQPIKLVK
jgi:hypothetical protein